MALPTPSDIPALRRLQGILSKCNADDLSKFPMPTHEDFAFIGALVVLYSYIDFNLRRIVEVMDAADKVEDRYKGKTGRLNITEVEDVVKTGDWSEANQKALSKISALRRSRNLVAHFSVRRFPNDDAYLFMTKSARDFKQVFGQDPEPGVSMTVVVEEGQLKKGVKDAENLLAWLAKVTVNYEAQWYKG